MYKKNQIKQLKYKKLLKLKQPLHNELRILKFKRPKWFIFKKIFINKFLRKPYLFRSRKNVVKLPFFKQIGYYSPKRWIYLRSQYRESLLAKTRIYYFFKLKTKTHLIKQKSYNENILFFLESRLDVSLWRAGFFETPAIARFFILHKNIYLNRSLCNKSNLRLQYGDLIECSNFAKKHISCAKKKKNLEPLIINKLSVKKKKEFLPSPLFEINWNTLTFIFFDKNLSKNLNSLSYLYNLNLNLLGFQDYLHKL